MRVAVTGSNGFIGQHLCTRLRFAGFDVRAGVRRDVGDESLDEFLRGVDVVVHAAGATRAPTRDELRQSNVELTRRVARAAAENGAKRFIFISSQAAAGPAASRDAPVSEDDAPHPIEAYGRSKLEAESEVRAISGLDHVIVRPAAVYGPGDRDFLPLFRLARRGWAIHPGNRRQWISLIHVDDVATAIVGIVADARETASAGDRTEAEARGGARTMRADATYFLANDAPMQWTELYQCAAHCAGRRIAADVEVPASVVRVGAAAGDLVARLAGRAGLLTSEKVALSVPRFWICSNERAKRELGFAPRIAVGDGMAAAYDWYQRNRWL